MPMIRPVDRCKWQQWCYINDHGMPVAEVTTMLFMHVVAPACAAIVRAMER